MTNSGQKSGGSLLKPASVELAPLSVGNFNLNYSFTKDLFPKDISNTIANAFNFSYTNVTSALTADFSKFQKALFSELNSTTQSLKGSNSQPVSSLNFLILNKSLSTANIEASRENVINIERTRQFCKAFGNDLLNALRDEPVIPGELGLADRILRDAISINAMAAMHWLSDFFLSRFAKSPTIASGIVMLVGRLPYEVANPTGVTVALSALVNKATSVQEAGIRAFENWANHESLKILQSVSVKDGWLKRYLEKVIDDIRSQLCLA